MNRFLLTIAIASLYVLCTAATAQAQSAAAPPTRSAISLEGAVLYAELSKTVDAKKAKPGDTVTALLLADVVSHGKIVAQHDAKLRGYVTEAQAFSKDNPESRLGIAFDKVVLKGGQEIPFHSTLIAIRPAPQMHFDVPQGPSPLIPNPAMDGPTEERHYPIPKGKSPRMSNPGTTEDMRPKEMKGAVTGIAGMKTTDIDGLSLSSGSNGSGQAVVCSKHTVKLEGGIRLELRVTDGNR